MVARLDKKRRKIQPYTDCIKKIEIAYTHIRTIYFETLSVRGIKFESLLHTWDPLARYFDFTNT